MQQSKSKHILTISIIVIILSCFFLVSCTGIVYLLYSSNLSKTSINFDTRYDASYESLKSQNSLSTETQSSDNSQDSINSSTSSISNNSSSTIIPDSSSHKNPLNLNFDVNNSEVINAFGLDLNSDYPNKSAKSIYKDITFTPAKVSNSANVDAVTYLYSFLKKGGSLENTSIQSGYDVQKLKEMVQTHKDGNVTETIPKEYEYLYVGDEVKKQIREELLSCRQEYVSYLKFKGVNQKYIDELDRVFAPDLSTFEYDDSNNPETNDIAYIADNDLKTGTKKMMISAPHIYFGSYLLKKSGILSQLESQNKNLYEQTIRTLSIRTACYHEYTHVLQYAVGNVNKGSKGSANIRNEESIYYANSYLGQLLDESKGIFYNLALENMTWESQADGIGFQILVDIWDFSPSQRKAWYDYEYGRLKYNRERVNNMVRSFWKDFKWSSTGADDYIDLTNLGQKLSLAVITDIKDSGISYDEKKYLSNMVNADITAWLGYLNPNPRSENEYTFEYLKNTHIDTSDY